jgi:hypothetical protein
MLAAKAEKSSAVIVSVPTLARVAISSVGSLQPSQRPTAISREIRMICIGEVVSYQITVFVGSY